MQIIQITSNVLDLLEKNCFQAVLIVPILKYLLVILRNVFRSGCKRNFLAASGQLETAANLK